MQAVAQAVPIAVDVGQLVAIGNDETGSPHVLKGFEPLTDLGRMVPRQVSSKHMTSEDIQGCTYTKYMYDACKLTTYPSIMAAVSSRSAGLPTNSK